MHGVVTYIHAHHSPAVPVLRTDAVFQCKSSVGFAEGNLIRGIAHEDEGPTT